MQICEQLVYTKSIPAFGDLIGDSTTMQDYEIIQVNNEKDTVNLQFLCKNPVTGGYLTLFHSDYQRFEKWKFLHKTVENMQREFAASTVVVATTTKKRKRSSHDHDKTSKKSRKSSTSSKKKPVKKVKPIKKKSKHSELPKNHTPYDDDFY